MDFTRENGIKILISFNIFCRLNLAFRSVNGSLGAWNGPCARAGGFGGGLLKTAGPAAGERRRGSFGIPGGDPVRRDRTEATPRHRGSSEGQGVAGKQRPGADGPAPSRQDRGRPGSVTPGQRTAGRRRDEVRPSGGPDASPQGATGSLGSTRPDAPRVDASRCPGGLSEPDPKVLRGCLKTRTLRPVGPFQAFDHRLQGLKKPDVAPPSFLPRASKIPQGPSRERFQADCQRPTRKSPDPPALGGAAIFQRFRRPRKPESGADRDEGFR